MDVAKCKVANNLDRVSIKVQVQNTLCEFSHKKPIIEILEEVGNHDAKYYENESNTLLNESNTLLFCLILCFLL